MKDFWDGCLFDSIESLVKSEGKYEGYQVVFQEDNASPHEENQYSKWLKAEFDKRG